VTPLERLAAIEAQFDRCSEYHQRQDMIDVFRNLLRIAREGARDPWHPVSDPPPTHGYYLVALPDSPFPGPDVMAGFWDGEMWEAEEAGHSLDPTHWMPMPRGPT
jgi:hypothetical protein